MAFVMTLNPPSGQMNRILNVSGKVGPHQDCANQFSDVEAVQRLIAIAARAFAGNHGFPVPQPTGRYDPLTGFYIYNMQDRVRQMGQTSSVIDGAVSTARGVVYGRGVWTIVHFNSIAFNQDRAAWEALLARFPAGLPT